MIYLDAYILQVSNSSWRNKIAEFIPTKGKECKDNSSLLWHTKKKMWRGAEPHWWNWCKSLNIIKNCLPFYWLLFYILLRSISQMCILCCITFFSVFDALWIRPWCYIAASKLRNKPAFSNIILFLNSKESILIARFRRLPRSLKTNQYPTSAALESCSITHPQFFLSLLSMFDSNQTTLVLGNNSDFIMKAHPLYQSGPISKIFRGFVIQLHYRCWSYCLT